MTRADGSRTSDTIHLDAIVAPKGADAIRGGAVERQDALLEALLYAAERFLRRRDWRTDLAEVLGRLGEAADVSRVYVFENEKDEDGRVLTSQRVEWTASGVSPQIANAELQRLSLRAIGFARWEDALSAAELVEGAVASFPESEREFLRSQEILSLAVVPIFASGRWWGFIGFDDCLSEREWAPASLAVLRTAAGLFGAAVERSHARAELEASEHRFQLLADATVDGVLIHDGKQVLDVNSTFVSLLGFTPEEVIGSSPFDFVAPETRDIAIDHARLGSTEPYEAIILAKDGGRRPVEIRGGNLMYQDRMVRFVSVHDLTHRKKAEESERRLLLEQAARAEAEIGEARAAFLAEASRVLSSSFDYETTLAHVARLTVGYLADYCVIDMVDGMGLRRVAAAAAQAAEEPLVQQLREFVPALSSSGNPIVSVLHSAEPLLISDAREVAAEAVASTPEHLALLTRLGPRSAIFVPIKGSSEILGVISLVATASWRRYSASELNLAMDLASRTALAIQSAQLFYESQQASRARDEILSVVAHDLRNPLGAIQNSAELLIEFGADDRQRRSIQLIMRAADGMNRLINDLLEVTRIESGRLTLHRTSTRIETVLKETVSMLRPLAAARDVEIQVEPVVQDTVLLADGTRIQQVLSNLVGNAVKFSPAGGRVTVTCRIAEGAARFAVIDTGPGIAPEEIPHVFGRFWQGTRSDRRGTGLGLAIAKELVEAHGGRIWLESPAGEGARFFFTIPLSVPLTA